jgi:UTP--glucose-1-phosphate uridylyltransferase
MLSFNLYRFSKRGVAAIRKSIKTIRKAIFPVAGLGTRFLPATKVLPKEMLILGDRPLIQHAFDEAREAGIEEFIFIGNRDKDLTINHFRSDPELLRRLRANGKYSALEILDKCTVENDRLFVAYQDQPLGLGHAVWCAKELIGDEPFAVILPDDVIIGAAGCLKQMIEIYNEVGGNLVSVESVPRAETSKYGVLDTGKISGKLIEIKGLVEKPAPEDAPSTYSIVGRYLLQPEIFGFLATSGKGSNDEIQLTDSMAGLIGIQPFHGVRFEGSRYDCGSSFGLSKAAVAYAMNDNNTKDHAYEFIQSMLDEYVKAAA